MRLEIMNTRNGKTETVAVRRANVVDALFRSHVLALNHCWDTPDAIDITMELGRSGIAEFRDRIILATF